MNKNTWNAITMILITWICVIQWLYSHTKSCQFFQGSLFFLSRLLISHLSLPNLFLPLRLPSQLLTGDLCCRDRKVLWGLAEDIVHVGPPDPVRIMFAFGKNVGWKCCPLVFIFFLRIQFWYSYSMIGVWTSDMEWTANDLHLPPGTRVAEPWGPLHSREWTELLPPKVSEFGVYGLEQLYDFDRKKRENWISHPLVSKILCMGSSILGTIGYWWLLEFSSLRLACLLFVALGLAVVSSVAQQSIETAEKKSLVDESMSTKNLLIQKWYLLWYYSVSTVPKNDENMKPSTTPTTIGLL